MVHTPNNPQTGHPYTAGEFAAAAHEIADALPLVVPVPEPGEAAEPSEPTDGLQVLQDRIAAMEQKDRVAKEAQSLRFEPNKPPSEAATDQGHRQPIPSTPRRRRSYRQPRPLPGPIRGDSEIDEVPAGHEPFPDLSSGEAQAGQLALRGLRESVTAQPNTSASGKIE